MDRSHQKSRHRKGKDKHFRRLDIVAFGWQAWGRLVDEETKNTLSHYMYN